MIMTVPTFHCIPLFLPYCRLLKGRENCKAGRHRRGRSGQDPRASEGAAHGSAEGEAGIVLLELVGLFSELIVLTKPG